MPVKKKRASTGARRSKKKKKDSDVSLADEMIAGTASSVSDTSEKKSKKITRKKKRVVKKKTPLKKKKEIVEESIDPPQTFIDADELVGAHDIEDLSPSLDMPIEIESKKSEEREEPEEEGEEEHPLKQERVSNFVASKASLEHIDEQLTQIYKNGDGTLPNMSRFQTKKRGRFLRALFLFLFTCLLLGVIGWVGLFVIQPRSSFSEDDVILSISGEETVVLGQEIRYRLRYRNAQDVPLSQAQLQIRYPAGFVFSNSSEEAISDANDTWALGTIPAHGSGYIDIYGTLYGDVGEAQSFRAFLNYLPANFSSEFQKVATANIEVADAPVSLEIVGPETVIPGIETTFDIVVARKQQEDVSVGVLAIEIDPGTIFLKKNSSLSHDQFYEYRWTIDPHGEELRIQVTGSFLVDEGAERASLPIRILGWDTEGKEGDGYVYAEEVYEPVVVHQEISVTPVVNGATNQLTVQPGEVLHASLVVRNNGEAALEQVEIRAVFDAPSYERKSILHWSEVVDEYEGNIVGEQISDSVRRGIITWGSRQIPGLRSIGPGEEVTLDIRLPIQSGEETTLTNFDSHILSLVGEIKYIVNGEQEVLSSSPVTMTLNSDVSLDIRDEQGKTSDGKEMHTIVWLLQNTYHELTNITLSADVYGDTTFVEDELVTPAGDVEYDADLGALTWTIESMPTTVDVLPLQFVLVRNTDDPSQSQLMSKVQVRGTDSVTGEQIILVGDELLLGAPRIE